MSIWHHIVSPLSKGLFRSGISESGFGAAAGLAYSLNRTNTWAVRAGCNFDAPNEQVRNCLLNKTANELITQANENGDPLTDPGWSPTVDGIDLTDYPRNLLLQGKVNKVAVLGGINTDEGAAFIWPSHEDGMSKEQFEQTVREVFMQKDPGTKLTESQLEQVFQKYPLGPRDDPRMVLSKLFTDESFLCGTQLFARRGYQLYVYRFNHHTQCPDAGSIPGAYHGLELPYVFGTPKSYQCQFSEKEQALSMRMQTYWANFAKSVRPADNETFPPFTVNSQRGLVLDTSGDSIEQDYREEYCDFWSKMWTQQREPHVDSQSIYV